MIWIMTLVEVVLIFITIVWLQTNMIFNSNIFQLILPYSVSKTALLGLTKALSFELGPENIRVNCVAPGIIDTKFASSVSPTKVQTLSLLFF